MDGQRFDQLARRLAAATSRRQVLKSFTAGLGATLLGTSGISAQGNGGNSDCAHFCKTVFSPGRARGQCTSDAAHGQGLCPVCGADASRVCVAPDGIASCPDRSSDALNCGGCNVVCASGTCVAGACLKLDGEACGGGGECLSTFCADGVCCDAACGGQCEACDVAGFVGTCSPVPAGASPRGGRQACAGTGACTGACDGSSTTCTFPDDQTICREATCADGVATLAAGCDGGGGCPDSETEVCSPGLCGDTACVLACSTDADCAVEGYCDQTTGTCAMDLAQGSQCGRDEQCGSGLICADGVCCHDRCDGPCESCNATGHAGVCTPTDGEPCDGGVCIDGDCCTDTRSVQTCEPVEATDLDAICCPTDEPCCPTVGCCAECFSRLSIFFEDEYVCCTNVCPAASGNRADDTCCDGGETCVDHACRDNRQVCADGNLCPEQCCGRDPITGGGTCCEAGEFCFQGQCKTQTTTACTDSSQCAAGEQCVGVTLVEATPDGVETIPGTCCPFARVCPVFDAPPEPEPGDGPINYCCGYGQICGAGPSDSGEFSCCSYSFHFACGTCGAGCTPAGTFRRP